MEANVSDALTLFMLFSGDKCFEISFNNTQHSSRATTRRRQQSAAKRERIRSGCVSKARRRSTAESQERIESYNNIEYQSRRLRIFGKLSASHWPIAVSSVRHVTRARQIQFVYAIWATNIVAQRDRPCQLTPVARILQHFLALTRLYRSLSLFSRVCSSLGKKFFRYSKVFPSQKSISFRVWKSFSGLTFVPCVRRASAFFASLSFLYFPQEE